MSADHDGYDSAYLCTDTDKYVMAPSVALFTSPGEYTVNPWRFSYCTVSNFIDYVDAMSSNGYVTKVDF